MKLQSIPIPHPYPTQKPRRMMEQNEDEARSWHPLLHYRSILARCSLQLLLSLQLLDRILLLLHHQITHELHHSLQLQQVQQEIHLEEGGKQRLLPNFLSQLQPLLLSFLLLLLQILWRLLLLSYFLAHQLFLPASYPIHLPLMLLPQLWRL